MSLVLGGRRFTPEWIETVCYLDDARIPRATDTNARTSQPQAIVLHTVHGRRGPLREGVRPNNRAEWYARYQANTSRRVSWDLTVDTDGTIIQSNDPVTRATWHAGNTAINNRTLGIELVQDGDGAVYEGQLDALVTLLDVLTAELGIQRQIPVDSEGEPDSRKLARLVGPQQGRDVYGIYGHRNCSHDKGPGDPGDWPFFALMRAGYECFDYEHGVDLIAWKQRQAALSIDADGLPGAKTRLALEQAGHAHGLWVKR